MSGPSLPRRALLLRDPGSPGPPALTPGEGSPGGGGSPSHASPSTAPRAESDLYRLIVERGGRQGGGLPVIDALFPTESSGSLLDSAELDCSTTTCPDVSETPEPVSARSSDAGLLLSASSGDLLNGRGSDATTIDAAGRCSIRVAVRIRPFSRLEAGESNAPILTVDDTSVTVSAEGPKQTGPSHRFAFDHVFAAAGTTTAAATRSLAPDTASQEAIYSVVGWPLLMNLIRGYNACLLCYGQTGSGKTYTMSGTAAEPGIVPRLAAAVFEQLEEQLRGNRIGMYHVHLSFLEIYNERVYDLLAPEPAKARGRPSDPAKGRAAAEAGRGLRVRHHPLRGSFVEGLSRHAVASGAAMARLVRQGNEARATAATRMNERSSRSHAIVTLEVSQQALITEPGQEEVFSSKTSRVQLVDLAGSERITKSKVHESARLQELTAINLSLSTLSRVIETLADRGPGGDRRPPYRESTLTWLLVDSFGGNSKTTMVANVSPAPQNVAETISTLRYAARARRIVNQAVINEDPSAALLSTMQQEVQVLRSRLQEMEARGAGAQGDAQEVQDLRHKLRFSEDLIRELKQQEEALTREWERKFQQLSARQQAHQDRQLEMQQVCEATGQRLGQAMEDLARCQQEMAGLAEQLQEATEQLLEARAQRDQLGEALCVKDDALEAALWELQRAREAHAAVEEQNAELREAALEREAEWRRERQGMVDRLDAACGHWDGERVELVQELQATEDRLREAEVALGLQAEEVREARQRLAAGEAAWAAERGTLEDQRWASEARWEAERGELEAAVLAVEGQLAELLAAQGQQLAAARAEAAAQQAALGAARGEWAAERAALMGQQEARQAQWDAERADLMRELQAVQQRLWEAAAQREQQVAALERQAEEAREAHRQRLAAGEAAWDAERAALLERLRSRHEAEVAALDAKAAAAEQRLREAAAAAAVLEQQAEEGREAQRQRLAACEAAWAAQRTVLEGRLQSEEARWADERSALREQLRDSETRWEEERSAWQARVAAGAALLQDGVERHQRQVAGLEAELLEARLQQGQRWEAAAQRWEREMATLQERAAAACAHLGTLAAPPGLPCRQTAAGEGDSAAAAVPVVDGAVSHWEEEYSLLQQTLTLSQQEWAEERQSLLTRAAASEEERGALQRRVARWEADWAQLEESRAALEAECAAWQRRAEAKGASPRWWCENESDGPTAGRDPSAMVCDSVQPPVMCAVDIIGIPLQGATAPSNAGDSEPPASPPPSPPASPIPACWTPAPASPRPDGGEAGDGSAGGEESLLADPALAEVLRQLQAQLEDCDARCRSASVDGAAVKRLLADHAGEAVGPVDGRLLQAVVAEYTALVQGAVEGRPEWQALVRDTALMLKAVSGRPPGWWAGLTSNRTQRLEAALRRQEELNARAAGWLLGLRAQREAMQEAVAAQVRVSEQLARERAALEKEAGELRLKLRRALGVIQRLHAEHESCSASRALCDETPTKSVDDPLISP